MSRTPTPTLLHGRDGDSDISTPVRSAGRPNGYSIAPPSAAFGPYQSLQHPSMSMHTLIQTLYHRPVMDPSRTPGGARRYLAISDGSSSHQSMPTNAIPVFQQDSPPAAQAYGRGRGRRRAAENPAIIPSEPSIEGARGRGTRRRPPQQPCAGQWGEHPEDIPNMMCPYDVSLRTPYQTIPQFHNLTTEVTSSQVSNFDEYVKQVQKSASSVEHLGYHVDFEPIFAQSTQTLENIVQVIYDTLTRRARITDPVSLLHELYDMWSQSFRFLETPDGERLDASMASLPRTVNETIARSLACIDCYKIVFTVLSHRYKQERVIESGEKATILHYCHEVIQRMHLVCRGFACFAQATTLGFEGNVSIERAAHDYALKLPFLVGIELPIDFNEEKRDLFGRFDPLRNPYQYFFRYIFQVAETNHLRLHGEMFYMEHIILSDAHPEGKIHTRFWKPFMDVKKFIYHAVQPIGQEHVFRAVISNKQAGMEQIARQLVESKFIKDIHPDFRYRSYRNGLYYMEIDTDQEPTLAWNDPARLNGRFIPYTSPLCPTNVASETFFDTDFDPMWLTCPVVDIDTPYLDTLLSTQNIHPDNTIESQADGADALGEDSLHAPIQPARPEGMSDAYAEMMREGHRRIEHLLPLLGESILMDSNSAEWKYSMSFVYAMALFVCGRCLRPLYTKIKNQLGESYRATDNYQCAPFFVGNPGTGKSTLLSIIAKMYHRTSTLELKCNSDSRFGTGQLYDENIKFTYMTETSRYMPWGAPVINGWLEGGTGEFSKKFKDPVTQPVTFTMAFAANPDQVPVEWISNPQQGLRRRLVVFQFNVSPEKSDSEFLNKIQKDEELAKMLVKFNRMYLIGRAYFDAVRMVEQSFNFVTYTSKHVYFSRVRADLFALASPIDLFFSQENASMIVLDSGNNKAYLLQDIVRLLKDFCAYRQLPVHKVPKQEALIYSLRQYQCKTIRGTVLPEELAMVPKSVEAVDKHGQPVVLDFVQGVLVKAAGYQSFTPYSTLVSATAGSSLSYQRGRGQKRARAGRQTRQEDLDMSPFFFDEDTLARLAAGVEAESGASRPSE